MSIRRSRLCYNIMFTAARTHDRRIRLYYAHMTPFVWKLQYILVGFKLFNVTKTSLIVWKLRFFLIKRLTGRYKTVVVIEVRVVVHDKSNYIDYSKCRGLTLNNILYYQLHNIIITWLKMFCSFWSWIFE